MISFLSRGVTLLPGDVIFTGTPEGVGMGRKPQLWLKDGDVVEVGLESVGTWYVTVLSPDPWRGEISKATLTKGTFAMHPVPTRWSLTLPKLKSRRMTVRSYFAYEHLRFSLKDAAGVRARRGSRDTERDFRYPTCRCKRRPCVWPHVNVHDEEGCGCVLLLTDWQAGLIFFGLDFAISTYYVARQSDFFDRELYILSLACCRWKEYEHHHHLQHDTCVYVLILTHPSLLFLATVTSAGRIKVINRVILWQCCLLQCSLNCLMHARHQA